MDFIKVLLHIASKKPKLVAVPVLVEMARHVEGVDNFRVIPFHAEVWS